MSSSPPRRVPPFTPVPLRVRADGWTPLRQAEFIGMLAESGSVAAAAQFVGMARETAYRLRARPGAAEFAAAWDAALEVAGIRRPVPAPIACSRKVTQPQPWQALMDGRWRVVLRGGRYCGSVREAHNSALLSLLAQLDRATREERKALRRKARSQATSAAMRVPPAERR
jgi:hypothetical protein